MNNRIMVEPQDEPSVQQVKEQVDAALLRQAHDDAESIRIEASGGKVTLSGHTSSWRSMADATHAAWSVAGVTDVVDRMTSG